MKFKITTSCQFYDRDAEHIFNEIKELERLGFSFYLHSAVMNIWSIGDNPILEFNSLEEIEKMFSFWPEIILSFDPEPTIEIYNGYRE
jgi:hypothetical protein